MGFSNVNSHFVVALNAGWCTELPVRVLRLGNQLFAYTDQINRERVSILLYIFEVAQDYGKSQNHRFHLHITK